MGWVQLCRRVRPYGLRVLVSCRLDYQCRVWTTLESLRRQGPIIGRENPARLTVGTGAVFRREASQGRGLGRGAERRGKRG